MLTGFGIDPQGQLKLLLRAQHYHERDRSARPRTASVGNWAIVLKQSLKGCLFANGPAEVDHY